MAHTCYQRGTSRWWVGCRFPPFVLRHLDSSVMSAISSYCSRSLRNCRAWATDWAHPPSSWIPRRHISSQSLRLPRFHRWPLSWSQLGQQIQLHDDKKRCAVSKILHIAALGNFGACTKDVHYVADSLPILMQAPWLPGPQSLQLFWLPTCVSPIEPLLVHLSVWWH